MKRFVWPVYRPSVEWNIFYLAGKLAIGGERVKLMQYADDRTLFVPNIDCAKLVLQLLDRFTICSGLKVNHTKTEAMWIGSCRQNTATPLGLR